MSTMVSNVYPLSENLHKDFQTSLFDSIDVGFSFNSSGLSIDANDQFSLMNNASFPAAWALQRPVGLTRRNSTSSVSSITASRNRMSNNPLTSIANIIPETSPATITAASILSSMSTTEEQFRSRAYSEGANSLSSMEPQQQPIASSRYKTELCRPFEENGKCKYGDKCQFAHGKQELRQLVRHPKYKTELCRTFHTSGFCPYGPRCHFIHNQEDLNKRGNSAMSSGPASGNLTSQTSQQNAFGMLPQRCAPVAVPTPHISERNHFDHRPSQLSILKQLAAGTSFGNMAYAPTSPLGSSPPYYHADIGQTVLMSPASPNSVTNGGIFNFNNVSTQAEKIPATTNGLINMLSGLSYELQHSPPPTSTFDMFRSQGISNETTVNDDSAFEGMATPPDSDRESLTGSPPEKQRLPIFRCLSQSD